MIDLKEKIKAAQIDLIKELEIDNLEQSQKEEVLTQIGEILQQRIVLRILEELPEGKEDEFKTILEKAEENPDQLEKYLGENIPGVEDLILEEIGEYKKGALDFMKKTLENAEVKDANKEDKEDEKDVQNSEGMEETEKVVEPEIKDKAPVELSEEKSLNENRDQENNLEIIEEPRVEEKNSQSTQNQEVEESLETKENKEEKFEKNNWQDENLLKLKEKVDEKMAGMSGIEKEQLDQEAKILEENKVESQKALEAELDLSGEIEADSSKDSTEEENKQ